MTLLPPPSFVLANTNRPEGSLVAPNYSFTETIDSRGKFVFPFEKVSFRQALISLERVSTIASNEGEVALRNPVLVFLNDMGDHFLAENPELKIFASGQNKEEALKDFGALFMASWDALRDESSDRLTSDAIVLKEKMASILGQ